MFTHPNVKGDSNQRNSESNDEYGNDESDYNRYREGDGSFDPGKKLSRRIRKVWNMRDAGKAIDSTVLREIE